MGIPYPVAPAILLGRLAIHEEIEGRGLGSILLVEALRRCHELSQKIGATGVIVDAIDEKALAWYQRFGFIQFPESRNRLFLPMHTIVELVNSIPAANPLP